MFMVLISSNLCPGQHWTGYIHNKVRAQLLQSCPTLCNPMGCSPPGSSVHGVSQARILEWVTMPFSRGSFQPGKNPCFLNCRWILYCWASREAPYMHVCIFTYLCVYMYTYVCVSVCLSVCTGDYDYESEMMRVFIRMIVVEMVM